jgi:parallel beta-helix repeat protein
MTIYYVDSSITDTHVASATPDFTTYNPVTFETDTGTASVYKTIADINVCTFSAGDSILFRKGQTWAEQLTTPSSGSAGLPITFGAYGNGNDPIIDGEDTRDNCINSNGKDYVTIDGIDLTQAGNVNQGVVFILSGSNNFTVQYCSIHDGLGYGVIFNWDAGASNIVDGNAIYNNAKNGISSYIHSASTLGNETYIKNNTVYNNLRDGIHIRAHYWIVENNEVYDNGSLAGTYVGIHCYSESAENSGDNNIIRYNLVYNQVGGGNDGSGIGIDQYCDNNQVYFNIIYGCDGPGIYAYDSDGISILNNTCYNNLADSGGQHTDLAEILLISSVSDRCTNIVLKNNIAQAARANVYAIKVDNETYDNTLTITNNCWYALATNWYFWNATGGATLATWNALTGVGTDINSDPLFVSTATPDFHLQSSSPCRNAGVNVGLMEDYEGSFVEAPPEIGVYEYESGKHLWMALEK